MTKIALLTCANRPELLEGERRLAKMFPPEIQADVQIWNDPNVNWETYNCLIFRTIWDYYRHPAEFFAWLEWLEKNGVPTLNSVATVKRNQHKFYLQELEGEGVRIIPTVFIPKKSSLDLSVLRERGWERAVIKPAISAGSFQTRLFGQSETPDVEAEYSPILAERDLLLQPFMPEIKTMGEISMIFFNGRFSHSILKTPLEHDFRVQVQYGGIYKPYSPENALIETGEKIVQTFGAGGLLYARVDGILRGGDFHLMELELIEPDLYFDFSEGARERFVAAMSERLLRGRFI